MKIAVVIPALEEAGNIDDAVSSALDSALRGGTMPERGTGLSTEIEVIVVDGGSQDGTPTLASRAGAQVIRGDAGRGRQQDTGWRATDSDVVLFLHADSRLPAGWSTRVCETMSDQNVAGGAFTFRFDAQGAGWRLLEWGVVLRVKLLGLPYGDQAIFVRTRTLVAGGGVPHVPIMEDLDLVALIKRAGRLVVLADPVSTSARRHRSRGSFRAVLLHLAALAAWYLDVDRERVAGWVRG